MSVRISSRRRLFDLGLRDLWAERELLYFMAWRDVKIRYKQTVFGAAWAVLQPFLMMVVFSVVLGKLVRVPTGGIPYPIFVYSGLIIWSLFAQALAAASESLVATPDLISKVYFSRLVLPVASAASFLLDFCISFVLLIVMMFLYHVPPSVTTAFVPAFALAALLTALAIGIWLAAMNVRYRDVRYAVPFLVQVWLFATPVAYPSTVVPARWRVLVGLNPMAGVVEGLRWALFGVRPPPGLLALSLIVCAVLLMFGVLYFRRAERNFADWV